MEFVVRGKTFTEEAAIEAIIKILESEQRNGKVFMTEINDLRYLPFKLGNKFKGLVFKFDNKKTINYVVVDRSLYRVYFYNADGIKDSESMKFTDYLIDTDYNR